MCKSENEELILCGLSLGAVLALNYAIDFKDKVKALVLIAAQYKMPSKLLKLQNILFRLMSKFCFNQTGFTKSDFINLCNSMATLDFTNSLHNITCPVLLVCGEKDKVNKNESIELANILKNSQFTEIAESAHEVNV